MTTSLSARDLASGKYLLLTTYRKNGVSVPTPVWVALDGTTLVVWTVADSGKVKRIRNNPTVAVAACTVRGKPLGPTVVGRAAILDAEGTRQVRRLIARKYWLTGRIGLFFSKLRRGEQGTVGIRIDISRS